MLSRESPMLSRESPMLSRESPMLSRESPMLSRESPSFLIPGILQAFPKRKMERYKMDFAFRPLALVVISFSISS
jgi:hypothetical protein